MKARFLGIGILLALLPVAYFSRGLIEARLKNNLHLKIAFKSPVKAPGVTPPHQALALEISNPFVEPREGAQIEWHWQSARYRASKNGAWRAVSLQKLPPERAFFSNVISSWSATSPTFFYWVMPDNYPGERKFLAAGEWDLTARVEASSNDSKRGLLYQGRTICRFKMKISPNFQKPPVIF